jgi:hypothetical protein
MEKALILFAANKARPKADDEAALKRLLDVSDLTAPTGDVEAAVRKFQSSLEDSIEKTGPLIHRVIFHFRLAQVLA